MPKELPMSSNMVRVSPYPLRSTRSNKHNAPNSLVQTENAREWEDIQCVICMEPPHNAILLKCSSNGCRPYMCDTSARHSNCFKQFRKNNRNRLNRNILNCPLCRGEVCETEKAAANARKFLNAKSKSCAVNNCDFSGTYSQLKNHMKTEHPGVIPTKVDPSRQHSWEQMQRNVEHSDLMNVADEIPPIQEEALRYIPIVPRSHVRRMHVDGTEGNLYFSTRFGNAITNYAPPPSPLIFQPTITFHQWFP